MNACVYLIAVQQLSSRAWAESERAGQNAQSQSMSQTLPASRLVLQHLAEVLLHLTTQTAHVTCNHIRVFKIKLNILFVMQSYNLYWSNISLLGLGR